MDAGEPDKEARWPRWLRPLLGTAFFVRCELHGGSHRNECNLYCLDCAGGALCPSCLAHHHRHHHRVIQIRRSSYHDVIRVAEIQRHLDVGGVQTYVINGARVVFLNERSQPRPAKGVANACRRCRRGLLGAFDFCSLGCKLAVAAGHKDGGQGTMPAPPRPSSCREGEVIGAECVAPPPPPPPGTSKRLAKRRKGTPRRAPTGVCWT